MKKQEYDGIAGRVCSIVIKGRVCSIVIKGREVCNKLVKKQMADVWQIVLWKQD